MQSQNEAILKDLQKGEKIRSYKSKYVAKFKNNKCIVGDDENWVFVAGYGSDYSVSSHGRVRSNGRFVNSMNGGRYVKERILKSHVGKTGYVMAVLGGSSNGELIHRLVANAFIINGFNAPCVNHKDGNKANNHVSNLEWCTYSENELHSYRVLGKTPVVNRLGKKGLQSYNSKPIIIKNKDGEIEGFYENPEFAVADFGISSTYLREMARGVKGVTKPFTVEYVSRDIYAELLAGNEGKQKRVKRYFIAA